MCWTCVICGTSMELFDLTNVNNVIKMTKINHQDMIVMLLLMMWQY
jgi:hypothetical protein